MQSFRILAIVILCSGTAAAGPYDGVYRPDADWAEGWDCKSVGMDGGALEIRGDEFFGVESLCKLSNPTPIRGMDAILYDSICNAEGETYSEPMILMTTNTGVAMVFNGGIVNQMLRCE